ncbi:MAG: glycosyltransferase [candidate division KSB1 bacterium]|nr:glycosyltransferase [candidate division KSB1 bacterium]
MQTSSTSTVGVIVITHNAKKHLKHCLPPLLKSSLNARVLVVNSSSKDGTVEEAQRLGAETLVIPRRQFNHGATREFARKFLATDIVVMITPDAYPTHVDMLEKLVQPILEKKAVVSYARQIPHDNADLFESFPRYFNYPDQSQLRGIEDAKKYGVYVYFCSNSCAAYLNSALDEIGGFRPTLTGEDTLAVAMLLRKGYKIAYVADAVVKHSHRYTLIQEFRRYFDTGLYRRQYRDLLEFAGMDEQRGMNYVKRFLKAVLKEEPHRLPYAVLQSMAKWLGYKIGRHAVHAPDWFKKWLSNQDFYWTSEIYQAVKHNRSWRHEILSYTPTNKLSMQVEALSNVKNEVELVP